jgi:hypothetical protein
MKTKRSSVSKEPLSHFNQEEHQSSTRNSIEALGPNDLDPFEINFLPQFLDGRGPREPFVNSQDVVIGDHEYESDQSPLQQWSKDTSPEVMSGDEWVHPFKDIGFHSVENRDYFEKGILPSNPTQHPDKDAAYQAYNDSPKESKD